MKERWRPIEGFEGIYEISDYGRVRSLARVVKRNVAYGNGEVHIKEKILNPIGVDYDCVRLYNKGRFKGIPVHRLVAAAFIPKKNKLHDVVRHRDDDPTNNHYKNLQWGTQYDNIQDRNKRGRTQRGEQSGHAKLKEKDVRHIIKLRAQGAMLKDLAAMYNVSAPHLSRLCRGQKWSYLNA